MKDSENILIGLVQMSMSDDPDLNLKEAIEGIRSAARRQAQIVCLPELFRTRYFCNREKTDEDLSEEIPGVVGQALSELSRELGITIVAGSIYEQSGSERFNTSLLFGPDGAQLGSYRKTHIPHDPSFFEQSYFSSGGENYQIFETVVGKQTVKIGVLICYDQWFPEAARILALKGAEIVFYPTAIGTISGSEESEGSWQNAWRSVQVGHAVANGMVVCAVNRVGREDQSIFWGGSFVCDAFGRILAEGSNRPEIITAEINLDHNREVREGWRFFKERRPETYQALTKLKVSDEEAI